MVVAARDHCMMDEEASTGQEDLLMKKDEVCLELREKEIDPVKFCPVQKDSRYFLAV